MTEGDITATMEYIGAGSATALLTEIGTWNTLGSVVARDSISYQFVPLNNGQVIVYKLVRSTT